MRPKTARVPREKYPGPGQYDPVSNKKRPPSAIIGRGSRNGDLLRGKESPGPAAYSRSTAAPLGPAFSFCTAKKPHKYREVPGPGTYKIPCSFANMPNYASASKSQEFAFI